jgi:hypothetical protein
MKKTILIVVLALIGFYSKSQEDKKWEHLVGLNLLGIPAATLDLNYEFSNHARYSYALSAGYTFDYTYNFDIIGFALSPHSKFGDDGYTMNKQ